MIDRIRALALTGWGWMTAVVGGLVAAGAAVVCCAGPGVIAALAVVGAVFGGLLGPFRRRRTKRPG